MRIFVFFQHGGQQAPAIDAAQQIDFGAVDHYRRAAARQTEKKAFAALLQEAQTGCGWINSRYLETVKRQTQQISCTVGFLAAWHVADSDCIHCRMRDAEASQRDFFEANLCRFDMGTFEKMGREVLRMIAADHAWSGFLIPLDTVSGWDSHSRSTTWMPKPDWPVCCQTGP